MNRKHLCCLTPGSLHLVVLVASLASVLFGFAFRSEADAGLCSPYIRSEIWSVGTGSRLVAGSNTSKMLPMSPEATYEARISAGVGSGDPGMAINAALGLTFESIVPNSFSVAPSSSTDSTVYWSVPGQSAARSFRFKVSNALYLWQNGMSQLHFEFNAWSACSGGYVNADLTVPLAPFVVAASGTGDFEAKAGKTYSVPITVGATAGQVVYNMKPVGPLQVQVIEGDADLIDCSKTPVPPSFSTIVGGKNGARQFVFTCTAKKKGKLRLSFPGVEAMDKDNNKLASNTIVQTGIVTISGGLKLAMKFDKTAVNADGSSLSMSTATVAVKDAALNPASGQTVEFDGPFWRVLSPHRAPRVFVCDETGSRVFPTTGPVGAYNFEGVTHSDGVFTFDVFAALDRGPDGASSPAQGLGNLQVDGYLSGGDSENPEDSHQAITLDVRADAKPSTPMATVVTNLQNLVVENSTALSITTSLGTIKIPFKLAPLAPQQRTMLQWMQSLREGGVFNADFGPIRSVNGSAAIVFYPRSNPGPLLDYFEGILSALPPDYDVMVLPIEAAPSNGLPGVRLYQPDFHTVGMKLNEWENGTPYGLSSGDPGFGMVRGKASVGIAQGGDLGFVYFGYPYPPSAAVAEDVVGQSACLNPTPNSMYLNVHSPVNILATDAQGNRTGITNHGEVVAEILESVVSAPRVLGKGETHITLPIGDYKVTMTGVAAGTATVTFLTPAAAGSNVRMFRFPAQKGATGSVKINAAGGGGALTFAGKKYTAQKALAMTVSTASKTFSAKANGTLRLVVKNNFGKPLAGARVTASAKKFKVTGRSNSKGIATLSTYGIGKIKQVVVTISATGYATVKMTMPVH